MPLIYHITNATAWQEAQQKGFFETPSLKDEGFIHCSEEHQVAGVVEKFYAEQSNLVKLVIQVDKLESDFVREWSMSLQDHFPHIYGPLNLTAVVDVVNLN